MTIDWSKAPEGATHYTHPLDDSGVWLAVFWREEGGKFTEAWSVLEDGRLKNIKKPTVLSDVRGRMIARPAPCSSEGIPPLESTVRIVTGGTKIWPDAEQFIGADCTLKAVFMTGDTQMVAVEHQENRVCCCFWASMVRTPEQIAAAEREASIQGAMQATYTLGISDISKRILIERLYDSGLIKQVKP